MIKSRLLVCTTVFLAGIAVLSANAQEKTMYSYTEEDGTVVFTDKAPGDREVESRPIPPGPPKQAQDNPYANAAAPATAAQQRREEIAQSRKAAVEEQKALAAQCAAWRSEKEKIEPHRRQFYTEKETGEVVRMDDVERANRVAELKGLIEANCP
jgi:hypothetical protein